MAAAAWAVRGAPGARRAWYTAACLAACVAGAGAAAGGGAGHLDADAPPRAPKPHPDWTLFEDAVLVILTVITGAVYLLSARLTGDDSAEARGAYRRKELAWRHRAPAGARGGEQPTDAEHALQRAREDADIVVEARDLAHAAVHLGAHGHARADDDAASASDQPPYQHFPSKLGGEREDVPLNISADGVHRPNAAAGWLLAQAGGPQAIKEFTDIFYERSFADAHLRQFIRDQDDPHAERMADWICEKMGAGTPWTSARAKRKVCPFMAHGLEFKTPTDRASAHYAAWHSPKRRPEDLGLRFQLRDCRVWMRLNFWALRESGIWERSPAFTAYYVKFIAHFVSVYASTAPQFARESARWSASPANIERYRANGNIMEASLFAKPLKLALEELPAEELDEASPWPYTFAS